MSYRIQVPKTWLLRCQTCRQLIDPEPPLETGTLAVWAMPLEGGLYLTHDTELCTP